MILPRLYSPPFQKAPGRIERLAKVTCWTRRSCCGVAGAPEARRKANHPRPGVSRIQVMCSDADLSSSATARAGSCSPCSSYSFDVFSSSSSSSTQTAAAAAAGSPACRQSRHRQNPTHSSSPREESRGLASAPKERSRLPPPSRDEDAVFSFAPTLSGTAA